MLLPGDFLVCCRTRSLRSSAACHWRNTLKEFLTKDLGYRQNRLDPTIFCLYGGEKDQLKGVIVVEIDDLLNFGDSEHKAKLDRLRERFCFGKFKELQFLPEGTSITAGV